MPSSGVIDAHVHLWQRARTPQDWIDPQSMQAIDRDFWFEDLDEVLHRNGVTSAVIVQASNSAQETSDLLTASLPASVGAIVGWVDLESATVNEDIARVRGLPNGAKLTGIRHLVHVDPDPNWLARGGVGRGLAALERAGLSFDLVVTAEQLMDCARVADEHPSLVFVLDHVAKPDLRSEQRDDWERGLRTLAAAPNVYAKLSGLTMEADWANWTVRDLEPVIAVALDCFGPSRLMFGSDWPLVEVCGGYARWLDAARELLDQLDGSERAAIFSGTARSAYRLTAANGG
jgi:L-fuconolactonase